MSAMEAIGVLVDRVVSLGDHDDHDLVEELVAAGVDRGVAARVVLFVPLAFGRRLLDAMGVTSVSDTFDLRLDDGAAQEGLRLDDIGEYSAAIEWAGRFPLNDPHFRALALRSSEVDALNQAMNAGSEPSNLVFSPPLLSWNLKDGPAPAAWPLAEWRQFVLAEVARQLTEFTGKGWELEGDRVNGSGTVGVVVNRHAGMGHEHVDFGFVLNRNRDDVPIIWDCDQGLGASPPEAIADAVEKWISFTAVVCLELLDQQGTYADHYQPNDDGGLTDWHVIHGPIVGFGRADGPELMQRWVLEHPILPLLERQLVAGFDRPELNGIKVLFGGDVAEVRINGLRNEPASAALEALDWPRCDPPSFARIFMLAIHGAGG